MYDRLPEQPAIAPGAVLSGALGRVMRDRAHLAMPG
jgi:hypothetical protein